MFQPEMHESGVLVRMFLHHTVNSTAQKATKTEVQLANFVGYFGLAYRYWLGLQ